MIAENLSAADQERHAADLVGVPYALGGHAKEGADCFGLVRLFYRNLGVEIPSPDHSVPPPSCQDWFVPWATRFGWKRVDSPEWGDTIVFRGFGKWGNHIGVYIGRGRILHSRRGVGAVISRIKPSAMNRFAVGTFRFQGGR